MSLPSLALALLALAGSARAAPEIEGDYDSPLGTLRVRGDGTTYSGRLVAPRGPCRLAAGEVVLKGTLLDDSLAGQVRLCLSGAACEEKIGWARAVLLAGPGGLSGAAHVAKGCAAPLGRNGGLTLRRLAAAAPSAAAKPAAPPAAARDRARAALRDGGAWLTEGNFERARQRFLEAIALDGRLPEAFNGVGVTYRMRDDLGAALGWYKKALAVDPDFGDAYYNMACVYALRGEKELALRFLQIAALNGYATATGIDEDPDLASVRDEPAYRALVKAKL